LGIFTAGGLNALESAEKADLYEAFMYLSADKAQVEYNKKMSKQKTFD